MRIPSLLSAAVAAAFLVQGSAAIAQQSRTVTTPIRFLPWEQIAEKDIAVKERVWRNIDREGNETLFATTADDSKGVGLTQLLLQGLKDEKLTVYDAKDDGRFLNAMSYEGMLAQLQGYTLTRRSIDPATGAEMNECVEGTHPGNAVFQYRIKEDWLHRSGHEAEVRILGVAPVVLVTNADGTVTERPLFWVYYPDNREFLASHLMPYAGKPGHTWEEYFGQRLFHSVATRVVESKNN